MTKNRLGHHCDYQWMVMAIIKWDGIQSQLADYVYDRVGKTLASHGKSLQRQCKANSKKTCACQVRIAYFYYPFFFYCILVF